VRRWIGLLLLVAVAALGLVALAAGFAVVTIATANFLGLDRAMGIDTQSSQNYDFVSGVGPMIIAALGFTGIAATAIHHLNCHVAGCPRLARYPVGDGQFRVCLRHHPDPTVRDGGVQAEHIAAAHEAHQAK
jgi:hypothetical protein